MADWQIIKTFNSREEAETARSFLEANGIPSRISADDAGGAYPSLAGVSSVKVLVEEGYVQRAKQILSAAS